MERKKVDGYQTKNHWARLRHLEAGVILQPTRKRGATVLGVCEAAQQKSPRMRAVRIELDLASNLVGADGLEPPTFAL